MTDREKVIKGLECCVQFADSLEFFSKVCWDCPYNDNMFSGTCSTVKPLLTDALALLKQEPVGGWISVQDRLPVRPPDVCGLLVRRQWYLVALESRAVLTLSYEFDEDRWQCVGSPVTHWMPLPEPPKGRDGNEPN